MCCCMVCSCYLSFCMSCLSCVSWHLSCTSECWPALETVGLTSTPSPYPESFIAFSEPVFKYSSPALEARYNIFFYCFFNLKMMQSRIWKQSLIDPQSNRKTRHLLWALPIPLIYPTISVSRPENSVLHSGELNVDPALPLWPRSHSIDGLRVTAQAILQQSYSLVVSLRFASHWECNFEHILYSLQFICGICKIEVITGVHIIGCALLSENPCVRPDLLIPNKCSLLFCCYHHF